MWSLRVLKRTLIGRLRFFLCASWLSVPPSSAGVCGGSASAAALCDRGVWGAAGPTLGVDHILHCTGQQGSPS